MSVFGQQQQSVARDMGVRCGVERQRVENQWTSRSPALIFKAYAVDSFINARYYIMYLPTWVLAMALSRITYRPIRLYK